MNFNINNIVKIKLTNHGRDICKRRYDDSRPYSVGCPCDYVPPEEDEEGWSRWQAWQLMEVFGAKIGPGLPTPFDANIIIEETGL